MPSTDLGPWSPIGIDAVAEVFSSAPFRWWISGGHALDLHLGRSWRPHEDTDVGVVRGDCPTVHAFLSPLWDLHVAAAGHLSPWNGEELRAAGHQNNVWCRSGPTVRWMLDVTIGDGSDQWWIYRRNPSVRLRWDRAVLRTSDDIPYLAPELQLLFKSKDPRPKDDLDAAEVIPALDDRQRDQLRRWLDPAHPWQRLLA